MSKTYELFHEGHSNVINRALDLYIDIGIGKFEEIMYAFDWLHINKNWEGPWQELFNKSIKLLERLGVIISNGGLIEQSDKVKIAVELKDQIKHYVSYCNLKDFQARVLVSALDFFTRIGIGQIEEISHGIYVFGWNYPNEWMEQFNEVREILDEIKFNLIGMPPNASYGIHSPEIPDEIRMAYDIQQVIRHRLAWDQEPNGGITIDFDKPMQCSTVALPTIKEI